MEQKIKEAILKAEKILEEKTKYINQLQQNAQQIQNALQQAQIDSIHLQGQIAALQTLSEPIEGDVLPPV